jgi:uncharacterized membrane protein
MRSTLAMKITDTLEMRRLAKGLGWFSIGLGLAEILAPRQLARMVGVRPHPVLFAALGAREIMSGLGILMQKHPTASMWSRVAGDLVDLSLAGVAFADEETDKEKLSASTAAALGFTAVDVWIALELTKREEPLHVHRSILINRPAEELYAVWRDFEQLPRFMRRLVSVTTLDEKRSRWVAKGPAGRTVTWEAEMIHERPNELIAWKSLPGSEVHNAGTVRFEPEPAGRGTFVRVNLEYEPPGGVLGALVAKLFGEEPRQQLQNDLYQFKRIMEAGELLTTETQPAARSNGVSPLFDTENVERG